MKMCSVCNLEKDFSSFTKKKSTKDGYNAACKECTRERTRQHYQKNKQYYIKKSEIRRKKLHKESYNKINQLKDVPCADCGIKYPPYVMDFDHISGDKRWAISEGVKRQVSWVEIKKEISKCEVVCANCHRERTFGSSK